jgi:hypothetical protein
LTVKDYLYALPVKPITNYGYGNTLTIKKELFMKSLLFYVMYYQALQYFIYCSL